MQPVAGLAGIVVLENLLEREVGRLADCRRAHSSVSPTTGTLLAAKSMNGRSPPVMSCRASCTGSMKLW